MNPKPAARYLLASSTVGVAFLVLTAFFGVEVAIMVIGAVGAVAVISWRKFAQIIERVVLEWWQ